MTTVQAISLHQTEKTQGADKPKKGNTIPPYYLAYFLFITALDVNQMSIISQSKEVGLFNDKESIVLAALNAVKYATLPKGAGPATVHRVNEENKQIEEVKSNLQQQLMLLRQTAQVKLTMTNTSMNVLQQIAGMTSSLLEAVHVTYQLIQKIAPVNIA
jgi:hypothetical protein